MKKYYDILELSIGASKEEVNKQYKKLVLKYHPDLNKSLDSNEKFKKINEAYEVLKRNNFEYSENVNQRNYNGNYSSSSSFFERFKTGDNNVFGGSFGNREGKGILDDFINNFFSKGAFFSSDKQIEVPDLQIDLNLNIFESINGFKRKILFKRKNFCIVCLGKKCNKCNFKGFFLIESDHYLFMSKSILNNNLIRIKNKGHQFKDFFGDILVKIKVKKNIFISFKQEDLSIHLKYPLLLTSLLNKKIIKIKIPNIIIEKKILEIEIARIFLNKKILVSNLGLKYNKKERGNLIVSFLFFLPENFSLSERVFFDTLSKKYSLKNISSIWKKRIKSDLQEDFFLF